MRVSLAVFAWLVTLSPAAWCQFAGGSGGPNDPFLVATPAQLLAVGTGLTSHYRLISDIDLAGVTVTPIAPGTIASNGPLFLGSLDGAGYQILNLNMVGQAGEITGLFGKVGPVGLLRDIHLVSVNVSGTTCVAALAAENRGTIERCSVTGAVSGDNFVGALVGDNRSVVSDSYSRASVMGSSSVGGLIGVNFLGPITITNCYAAGPVASGGAAGGLVGSNLGTSPTITNSFWDTATTGQASSPGGGVPRNTTQMRSQANYLGWDFADVWCIEEGVAYPENYGCSTATIDFVRGDANNDGDFNIADPIYTLSNLFPNGVAPGTLCADASDANDDGELNIADPVTSLGALFSAPTMPLPAPSGACGPDPTPDTLDCAVTSCP